MNTVLYYSSITTAKVNAIKGIRIFNSMKNSDLDGTAFFGKENKIVKYIEIFGDFYLGISVLFLLRISGISGNIPRKFL